ncbi:hypothetical protein [Williamsia phyllosphaerae]|uniref:Uncharacterized protein n=1 Tax=Williamsia phyllosphaerae TaxID=885042 RepID=A0ABQ1UHQ9_9NOCA|nr:hypothetical protein [Williamsia phyllosphaerae]GGF16954.1 hypothetical protein GCM10007298_11210 [Williamsia phyllosphaerae]
MASNYEFTGNENNQAGFRDKVSGSMTWLTNVDAAPVELLDDDEVIMTTSGQRAVWSIREQRMVRWP